MEPRATTFRYERPELRRSKAFVKFFKTDLMSAEVQVIGQGGENNLHTHRASDGFWMVLEGQARFYGEGDEIVADLGPLEGVHIPRGFPYWFESSGSTPLEIVHVSASVLGHEGPDRVDLAELKLTQSDKEYVDGSSAPPAS